MQVSLCQSINSAFNFNFVKIKTQIKGRSTQRSVTLPDQIFIQEDQISMKLILRLEKIQKCGESKVKFITNIQCSRNQPYILISSDPVFYKNEICYFLLTCKAKNERLMRICYLLSQVIYFNSQLDNLTFLNSLKLIQPYWKHRNLLLITKSNIHEEHYHQIIASRTSDSINQDRLRKSKKTFSATKNSDNQNQIIERLQTDQCLSFLKRQVGDFFTKYFTKIKSMKDFIKFSQQSLVDYVTLLNYDQGNFLSLNTIELIVKFQEQKNTNKMPKKYQISKYISLEEIYHKNVDNCLQIIVSCCINSYRQLMRLQFKQTKIQDIAKLPKLLRSALDAIQETFHKQSIIFIYQQRFITYYQQLNKTIKEEQLKVVELIEKCMIQHAMRKFSLLEQQEYIQFKNFVGMQDERLKNIFLNFDSYQFVLNNKIQQIFVNLLNDPEHSIRKKKKTVNFISNDKDMLLNIEDRVGINKAKKNALRQEIQLCYSEEQKLIEVQAGLQIQLNIKNQEDFKKGFNSKKLFKKNNQVKYVQYQN